METIKYIVPIILFTSSVLALFFAVSLMWSAERKHLQTKLLAAFCAGSAIWSVGFGALILQTNTEYAYRCRAVGMVGTFMYLILVQFLVSHLSGIKRIWAILFNSFASLGIFIYFMTVERSQTIYHLDTFGMTYSFKPGIANTLYSAYSVILAIILLGISIYMCSSKIKRFRYFGKIFIIADGIMIFGTVLDTIFPLVGIPAFPGSTLTQFWGLIVLYIAIRADNRSKINISNMSEFIYYSLSMPVLVYDNKYQLQIANDSAAKFLSLDQTTLTQQNHEISMLFQVDNNIFDFLGNRSDYDTVCSVNNLYCNLAVNKIQDRFDDTIGFIIIITDLSERMKNLQHLEEAKQEAEAANRSKSAFLANMSHEIRTPMNAIMGFSELILKMDASPTVREYVSDIRSSSQNLLAVINDILDISKLDSGKMELNCGPYYTHSLLQDVYHIIEVQARKKGLEFTMNTSSDIPHQLHGDVTRIRGILINILNNAVKYTPEGSITFNIRVIDVTDSVALIEYTISDTGIGIKESTIEHLFDSFARFDRKKNDNIEGTGLGLSIVKGYVGLMNGDIKVDSTYGEGSTFTVTLAQKIINASPMAPLEDTKQENSALNTAEIRFKDTTVLVTDDNHINLKVIRNTLEYYGLKVDTADSGAAAIELCASKDYDLIFMDQMMPQMDGIETMQEIRRRFSHYATGAPGKIIALTANAISGVREELISLGFDEYLHKPIVFEELEWVIASFIPADRIVIRETLSEPDGPLAILAQNLPELNVTEGLANCSDDTAFYLDILQMLYDDSQVQINELKNSYAHRNYTTFAQQMRGLRNQLLNISHANLSFAAKFLEDAATANQVGYIDFHLVEFLINYERFLEQLKHALNGIH